MRNQRGFTLLEIVVATALFVVVVTVTLDLFSYTLKTNRKVQSIRIAAQGIRTFAESLAREVRNGEILYDSGASLPSECRTGNYNSNKIALLIRNLDGDQICFYMKVDSTDSTKGRLYVSNFTSNPPVTEEITSNYFWVSPTNFSFNVSPSTSPRSAQFRELQPMVTLSAEFNAQVSKNDTIFKVPYQTSISSDLYDIPYDK